MKKVMMIDVPDSFDQPYLLQQIVFEHVDTLSAKYIKDYVVLYIKDKKSSKYIEKLINGWDLDSIGYKTKLGVYNHMIELSDEAIIFLDNESKANDEINNIIKKNKDIIKVINLDKRICK